MGNGEWGMGKRGKRGQGEKGDNWDIVEKLSA